MKTAMLWMFLPVLASAAGLDGSSDKAMLEDAAKKGAGPPDRRLAAPKDQKDGLLFIQRLQEQEEQRLKEADPEAYRRRQEFVRRQADMREILRKWREGSLSDEGARKRLFPLVKPEVEGREGDLEARIERLEKKLALLKRARKDPSALVWQRIDELLSRGEPDPMAAAERGGAAPLAFPEEGPGTKLSPPPEK